MVASHDRTGLDRLDPATHRARDIGAFRRIVAAAEASGAARAELAEAVRQARNAGDSWTGIAVALGTTRQAARQRFAKLTG